MAINQNTVVPDAIDPRTVIVDPPPAPRGALGEIGTGLARGALVGLPSLAGNVLKYISEPGQGVYEAGKGMVESAEKRGQAPGLSLTPEGRGSVVNALASGAEMLPAMLPIAAAGIGAAALGAPAALATGVGALAGGGLFGADAGQRTLEKARAAGVDESTAREAARLNAGVTMAGQTALGMVGGQLLGTVGKAVGPMVNREGQALAQGTLAQLTGSSGALMPFLKAAPVVAGEAVATNAAQAAASAEIERRYGADTMSPLDAAIESIGPTLGMTALMGPAALVSRAMGVRSAKQRTDVLANADSPVELRNQLADSYATELAKRDPAAAQAFRDNARVAIENNQHLPVDSNLLTPDFTRAPAPAPDAFTTALGATPERVGPEAPPVAPAFESNWTTSAGAAEPRTGLDFQREVDTRALELADLHGQIKSSLQEAGIPAAAPLSRAEFNALPENQGKRTQDTARGYKRYLSSENLQRDLMRRDADAFDALQKEPAAPAIPDASVDTLAAEPVATEAPAKAPLENRSMADAMTAAFKRADEDRAYAERLAKKETETAAIANIGAGERTAAAAEAGQITGDLNAPKARKEISADWHQAMLDNDMDNKAQALTPFMKRLDSMGVMDMKTHQEQIDALQTIIDDKKASQSMKDRAAALKGAWEAEMPAKAAEQAAAAPEAVAANGLEATAARAGIEAPAPATAAALGENIPVSAPDNAAPPPKVAAAFEPLAPNLEAMGDVGVSTKAEAIADRVAELRVQMNDRVRAGEKLSPLEQERMDDLGDFARALTQFTEGRATPADAHWIGEMAKMVDEASKPYTESFRMVIPGLKVADPRTTDVGLLAPALSSRKVADVLENMATNGSTPWVKTLSARLQKLLPDTEIGLGMMLSDADRAAGGLRVGDGVIGGEYKPGENRIDIYPRGASEEVILHESTHAATAAAIDRAAAIKSPKGQDEARLVKAHKELEALRKEISTHVNAINQAEGGKHYGLTNIHEFVAEAQASAEFQQFLRNTGGREQNLWNRFVEGVRKLLGLPPTETNVLSRAMTLSDEFFSDRMLTQEFNASPEGAGRATDVALRRVIASSDDFARAIDPGKAELMALRGALPLQTVGYIANRVKANPEMVSSGFAKGVEAYQRANNSHEVVANKLNDAGSKYIMGLQNVMRGMEPTKAKALEREMMTIGGEAAIGQFDYRKNGKDNLAADSSIQASKEAMDETHRRFTQLQKTNPAAAKALEDGERLNRQMLTQKVATIAANLLDDFAGRARHLEAEIARMTPTDANYARRQDMLKLATTEAVMADRYAKALDLQDPTLAQGKNGDPTRWADVSAYNLHQRLQAAMRDANTLPENSSLRNALKAVESLYANEVKYPYFSLGRDGDFFVKAHVKGIDKAGNDRIQQALQGTNKIVGDLSKGDSTVYFRVKTADEAQALHDRLVTAGQGKVTDTAWGRAAERADQVGAVSPALRTLLSSVDDMRMDGLNQGLKDQVKKQLADQLMSLLPETAARNASMGRKGVPGYDADFLQRFASRAQGAVHDISSVYTSRAYMAAATQRAQAIQDLNRTGSADGRQRAQLIDDEINKRYSNALKPTGPDWVSKATSLSHSFYLGLSPANYIRTMAQLWHRGLPVVGSKFGFAQTSAELAKGQAIGMKMVANSVANATRNEGVRGLINAPLELQNLGLNPAEQAWVNEAHASGKLGLGESAQLMRAAKGDGGRLESAMQYASATIQYAEMANRFGLGLAAFRLASKRPSLLAAGETPGSYALKAMEYALDDFSPMNTARAIGKHGFAGQMTPLLAQFQNYNLQTMQQIARTVHDGFFGKDKSPEGLQRAKEARKEFGGLMATTATIAGAMGMPFANVFAGLYNTLLQDDNKPEDVRVAMRNWATGTFGKDMGNVLMKGLPSLLGVDTSTFGAQGILPGSEFLADRTMWKERSESQVRSALGPAVSLGLDLTNAVDKMSDGYWLKGIEAALPIGIRSLYKTGSMIAGDGFYTDSKGNPTPMPITGSDIAWRALGFQTEDKAAQGMAQRDFMINQQRLAHQRKLIQDQFVKGSLSGDTSEAAAALQAYNQANPLQPMTSADVVGAIRNYHMQQALGAASGLNIPVTKRGFLALQESAPFAAMPTR